MIQQIKSFFNSDLPKVPSTFKKSSSKPIPLMLDLDYCHRYRPLFSIDSFNKEMEETNGEMADYFEPHLKKQYQNFKDSNQYIMYGSWGISLLLAVYCDKLRVVNRLLGGKKWMIFALRVGFLTIPYYFVDDWLEQAKREEGKYLYSALGKKYQKYKLSGDIAELNSQIELLDEPVFKKELT